MTPQERKAEFDRLYKAIPAKANIERIRKVCSILFCQPNTVRGWTMKKPHRIITEAHLKILKAHLEREGIGATQENVQQTRQAGAHE
ncbi:MAG: hypothetical protein ABFD94_04230 [Armatimonadia bacterium]